MPPGARGLGGGGGRGQLAGRRTTHPQIASTHTPALTHRWMTTTGTLMVRTWTMRRPCTASRSTTTTALAQWAILRGWGRGRAPGPTPRVEPRRLGFRRTSSITAWATFASCRERIRRPRRAAAPRRPHGLEASWLAGAFRATWGAGAAGPCRTPLSTHCHRGWTHPRPLRAPRRPRVLRPRPPQSVRSLWTCCGRAALPSGTCLPLLPCTQSGGFGRHVIRVVTRVQRQ
jgi:hypothetical protein